MDRERGHSSVLMAGHGAAPPAAPHTLGKAQVAGKDARGPLHPPLQTDLRGVCTAWEASRVISVMSRSTCGREHVRCAWARGTLQQELSGGKGWPATYRGYFLQGLLAPAEGCGDEASG